MYQYSGINAKIKAMMGKRLTLKDYEELINKRSVGEIASYLKFQTSYASALSGIQESNIHRGELERHLYDQLFNEYIRLKKFVNGETKKLLKAVSLRYELRFLQNMIQLLNAGHIDETDALMHIPQYFLEDSNLDFNRLVSSKNFVQFIENLQGTVYYDVLKPFITNQEHLNLFHMENSLDMFYYTYIWKLRRKASGRDAAGLEELYAAEADLTNIMNAYRFITFFHLPKENIYAYIIPFSGHLGKDQLRAIVEAASQDKCIVAINETRYKNVFHFESGLLDIDYKRQMYQINSKIIKQSRQNFAILAAYLYVLENEIKNIISIVEGIRYQLPPEEIRKYIVM